MANVTNISNGPRGAYLKGVLVMAEAGEAIEADDFADEWFAEARGVKAKAESAKSDAE